MWSEKWEAPETLALCTQFFALPKLASFLRAIDRRDVYAPEPWTLSQVYEGKKPWTLSQVYEGKKSYTLSQVYEGKENSPVAWLAKPSSVIVSICPFLCFGYSCLNRAGRLEIAAIVLSRTT